MRAFWRRALVPLIMGAAVLSAGSPALFAINVVHTTIPQADCPAGTNWDHIKGICD
jgi:hypothetical protein